MKTHSYWLAAKQVIEAEESKLTIGLLDRLTREFLDWIIVRCQSDEPLFIQEVVMESQIASPRRQHINASAVFQSSS